ncbi:hypothetical protein ILYODFUR_039102 [Ilyodon furcidens]|uniref:Uncharacterized protein n=1 Tax=Ilyodon furcidens TaxID=33524 RepID=A0ABV0U458_9TELE
MCCIEICQEEKAISGRKGKERRKKRAWIERFKKGSKTKKKKGFFLIPYSVPSQRVFKVCFESIPRWIQ